MTALDQLLSAIRDVHAAGLDERHWPSALGGIARILDGTAATLEVLDKKTFSHREFRGFNIPCAAEMTYLARHVQHNPRWRTLRTMKAGDIVWDYQHIDEPQMNTDPFYADFLAALDLRYYVGAILASDTNDLISISVQYATARGHAQQADIDLMKRLLPHVQQAQDVSHRLRTAKAATDPLERVLDTLREGVALIGKDGGVIHMNDAFASISRRGDGLTVRDRCVVVADAPARALFAGALAAVLRLGNDMASPVTAANLRVPRSSGAPPYVVSVRPLVERERSTEAVALVFVHDISRQDPVGIGTLRDLFGLTEAEAALAQALQSGMIVNDYARKRGLSLNTVYTHLRRLREKTGSNRLPELIHRLNELRLPLREE